MHTLVFLFGFAYLSLVAACKNMNEPSKADACAPNCLDNRGGSSGNGGSAGGSAGTGDTGGHGGTADSGSGTFGTGGETTATGGGTVGISGGTTTTTGGTANGGGTTVSGGSTAQGGRAVSGGSTSQGGTSVQGGTTASSGTTTQGGNSAGGGSTAQGGTALVGGTTAVGGTTTSSGGAIETGGVTATGGTTGILTAPACTPSVPAVLPLITDFSATGAGWHPTAGKWGTAGNLTGSIFSYAGVAGSMMSSRVDTTSQNLVLLGNVVGGDYAGGGLSFDSCVNTSTYTGVQFRLGGTVAGCDLYFLVQTFEELPAAAGRVGGCLSACYIFPRAKLPSAMGVVTVPFTELAGGLPAPEAIASEIVGLQWQFQSPPPVGDGGQIGCTGINLTITDVAFVSN